jgi:serine/threonine protein kinase/Tol biopolymer transport system component
MPVSPRVVTAVRFEGFELDVRAGELRRPDGAKARLGEQAFRILLVLLEHPRSVVLREEIRRKLWPNDTIVEFEHSIGAAMNRLRQALGDSADKPKYIETLARRGYRWMTEVERVEGIPAVEMDGSAEQKKEMEGASGDLIGRTVSHYKVLELLGSGGMGIIYKAEDVKLSRHVALKFLPDGMASDPRALERFQREALAISGLDHPNICTIYEVDEHVGQPFLVMQLLEGKTLRERIASHTGQRACFRNEELLDISLQIASGLEAAHQKGLLHRDIKPANIFLTNRGEAKILDFGLAKLVESAEPPETPSPQNMTDGAPMPAARSTLTLSRTGLALGTPAYLSPEQVSGEKLDARTDVYSFGLVLYEMATGIRAISGNTGPEIHEAILDHPPRAVRELNPEVSRGLEQIVHRAIDKDREARYRDASEMREDLLRLKRGTSASRRPWEIGLAAALVLLSVAGAIFWAARRSTRVEPLALQPVPFTAYAGREVCPTFSPEGSQIAFAWDGDPESRSKGFDLYVKAMHSENLLRLTHHPSGFLCPAWSPDGSQIAFHRISGADTGVYVVPALGGSERKLRSTHIPFEVSAPISWSRDGKWIAYKDFRPPEGASDDGKLAPVVLLLSLETLESKEIPHEKSCRAETQPAFSHSGEQLAYICLLKSNDNEFSIYSVPLSGGRSRAVARFMTGWGWPAGFAWTADDKKLILSRPQIGLDLELDEVILADGTLRKLPIGRDGFFPAFTPAISAKGDKLAYAASPSHHIDIWRKDLWHPEAAAVRIISSTYDQTAPQYSPDGKHIAFASNRRGVWEIWMSDADGTQLVLLSDAKSSEAGAPHWSPDSQKIAFESRQSGHPEVFTVDITERMPRRLVTNLSDMSAPSWSHDGKWLYFQSSTASIPASIVVNRIGIFRSPTSGGNAIAISDFGTWPLESHDGKIIYFLKVDFLTTVHMASVEALGTESALRGMPEGTDGKEWTVVPGGIYFVPANAAKLATRRYDFSTRADDAKSVQYFDFATKHVRQIFEAAKAFNDGLSVSPDGRWILYTQEDEGSSDIMLVDHFH